MEKRSSDEPAALRRKKRRRKVVESSSEDQEEEQVEPKSVEEHALKPNPAICKGNEETIETETRPEGTETGRIPDDEALKIEARSEGVDEPQPAPVPDEAELKAEPKEQSEMPPAEVPRQVADPDPAPPATAEPARKRDNATKVLHAARAWLRAPVRKNDALMLERCAAMSGLTKKEIADFVEANVNRKPGEWCFTVVDERISAKKKEEEAIQVATGATSAAIDDGQATQPQEELLPSESGGASASCQNRPHGKRTMETAGADGTEFETDGMEKDAVVSPAWANSKAIPKPETKEIQVGTSEKQPAGQPPENADPKPAMQPMQRRRGPKPRAPKASSSAPPAPVVLPDLSCLEATSSGPRKFAPLRPGTRRVQSSATLTPTPVVEAEQPKPIRRGCRHPNVSKTGCAMVCDLCGEELLYDGWRLELCDELDVYNSATS